MVITSIKKQVKNPERVSVFVDGEYSFSLSLDELLKAKLKNNLEIDAARLKKLKKISADGKLKNQALAWVLNRPHSERELRDYLRRKKTNEQLADKIVNNFKQKGYQDDKKYAQWLVEVRSRKSKSNRAIRSELFSKGISRAVVEEVMEESGEELKRLQELAAKKLQNSRYRNDELKLVKYLTSQGFSYSQVREVLKSLNSG